VLGTCHHVDPECGNARSGARLVRKLIDVSRPSIPPAPVVMRGHLAAICTSQKSALFHLRLWLHSLRIYTGRTTRQYPVSHMPQGHPVYHDASPCWYRIHDSPQLPFPSSKSNSGHSLPNWPFAR
jgi:hypothetical protein